jgi:hypothetical protein
MRWIAACLIALATPIFAQTTSLPTREMCLLSVPTVSKLIDFNNGCGSGMNEVLVPDKAKLLGVDFTSACAAHDNCYSKCLPGGENYCKHVCFEQAKAQREGRRSKCDDNFLQAMLSSCSNAACKGTAFVYFWTVKIAGGGAFQGEEIPPSVRQALLSGDLARADYLALAREITDAKKLFAPNDRNRLRLRIENGEPVVFVSAVNPIRNNPVRELSSGISSRSTIRYGNVDLSESILKGSGATPARIDFKQIDPTKLLYQRRFEPKQSTP